MMQMYFHFGDSEVILFQSWTTSNWVGIVGSMVGVFLMAAIYEGLKNYRENLFANAAIARRENEKPRILSDFFAGVHLFQTLLHMLQLVIGYFLMLIFMTYNIWLCLAVTVGGGIGFWLFACRKTSSNVTDCCN